MKRTFQNIARNLNSNDCKDEIEDNYLPFSVPKHYKISFYKLIDMFAFFNLISQINYIKSTQMIHLRRKRQKFKIVWLVAIFVVVSRQMK
jgi:hypothetical protein